MNEQVSWVKSPHLLIYPSQRDWEILHRETKTKVIIPERFKNPWETWDLDQIRSFDSTILHKLLQQKMIIPRRYKDELKENPLDSLTPYITPHFVKYYAESPDTVVLFNTGQMIGNNPLLVLGPYGSLCWNHLLRKTAIREIRKEALRVFGYDEVLAFLRRLIHLGFLSPLPYPEIWNLEKKEIMVKEFPANLVQFELPRTRIPWYVLWEICTQCDLRCRTCYLPHFSSLGPTSKHLFDIAEQLVNSGVFYVTLLGGEILLRDDIDNLIVFLRKNDLFVKIISNGQQLTYTRAVSFAQAGLNLLEVSFDGLSIDTNDASRGTGTFLKACTAVELARKAGILRQAVVWTVHSGNWDEVDELPRFLAEIGVIECYVSSFKKTGLNGAHAPWEPLSPHQELTLRTKLAEISCKHSNLLISMTSNCSCGRSSIVISPEDNLRLCTFSSDFVGNLRSNNFATIWKKLDEKCSGPGPHGYCE